MRFSPTRSLGPSMRYVIISLQPNNYAGQRRTYPIISSWTCSMRCLGGKYEIHLGIHLKVSSSPVVITVACPTCTVTATCQMIVIYLGCQFSGGTGTVMELALLFVS